MTREQISNLFRLQHKQIVAKMVLSNKPIAYTQDNVDEALGHGALLVRKRDAEEKLIEFMKSYGFEKFKEDFDEVQCGPDKVKFTLEEQRQATFEVIGERLTLEEVAEKYMKIK